MEKQESDFKKEFRQTLSRAKKYKVTVLFSFLVPIAISIFIGYRNFPTYNTKMLVRMSLLTNNEMSYFFKSLQDLVNTNDFETIHKKFFIPKEHSSKIKKIWIEKVKDKADGYIINLSCCNIECIKPIEDGIVSFMNYESSINEKNKLRKITLTTQLDSLNKQIAIMDTLVKAIRSNKGITSDVYPFYAANATMSLLQLYDKKNELNEKLGTTIGFNVIDSFLVPAKPMQLNLSKHLVAGIVAGFMISFFLLKEILPDDI